MPVEESTEEGVPAQWTPQTLYDFRSMPDGPRGYKVRVTKKGHVGSKRRLDEYREQVEKDAVANEDDVMGEDNEGNRTGNKRVKRTTRQNSVGAGKVSGRSWKVPGEKMSGLRSGSSKKLSTSWEKKMKEKAEMKDLRERKKMALEEKKAAARAAREQREEAKKRKEENRKKSVVTTVVSSATARRMAKSKKQRKKLVTVEG